MTREEITNTIQKHKNTLRLLNGKFYAIIIALILDLCMVAGEVHPSIGIMGFFLLKFVFIGIFILLSFILYKLIKKIKSTDMCIFHLEETLRIMQE